MKKDIRELFVPFDLALKLRNRGFEENCFDKWVQLGDDTRRVSLEEHMSVGDCEMEVLDLETPAPTFQQVVDWFREKHKLVINQSSVIGDNIVCFSISHNNPKDDNYANCTTCYKGRNGEYYNDFSKAIEMAIELI